MVFDLHDTHHKKPKLAIKDSKSLPMAHITDNPLDDFSNSDDQANHLSDPTGIISPPLF